MKASSVIANSLRTYFYCGKFHRKRATILILVVLATVLFMGLWRFALGAHSTRYWVAVPILTLPLLTHAIDNRFFGCAFSRFLAAVIFIAFCLKDIRFNYLQRAIRDASQAIVADSKQYRRAFCAELNNSGINTRVGYYSKLPVVSYPDGTRLGIVRQSAAGLYDVCYIVVSEKIYQDGRTVSRFLEAAGAEQIFHQHRNMHKKKSIMVYKLPIPQQQKPLPITGEIWENGGFERVSWRKSLGGEFPDGYSCENTAVRLTKTNVISGKYSLFTKGMGQSFVYSPLVSPPKNNCTIVFSVLKARFAQIKYEIWKFDRHGHLMSRKLLSNIIMANDDSLHQFQIPFHSSDFQDADKIRCYWLITAPYGAVIDDFGIHK